MGPEIFRVEENFVLEIDLNCNSNFYSNSNLTTSFVSFIKLCHNLAHLCFVWFRKLYELQNVIINYINFEQHIRNRKYQSDSKTNMGMTYEMSRQAFQ